MEGMESCQGRRDGGGYESAGTEIAGAVSPKFGPFKIFGYRDPTAQTISPITTSRSPRQR
jgi:hypothetical protein